VPLPRDARLEVLRPADDSLVQLRPEAVEPSVVLEARRSAEVPQVTAVQQELSLEMSVQWKPPGAVAHLAEPLERQQALPVSLQELVSQPVRSAQQVPQGRALPPLEPLPSDLARVPLLVSLQPVPELLEREQSREVSPPVLQPLAAEPAAMPLL
jgi:hypothetical protein